MHLINSLFPDCEAPHANPFQIFHFYFFLFYSSRASELQNSVAYDCVQLHGGWGYMWEYPIAKWVCRFCSTPLVEGKKNKNYWVFTLKERRCKVFIFQLTIECIQAFMILAHPEDFIIFKESEETNILKHNAWLYVSCYAGLI